MIVMIEPWIQTLRMATLQLADGSGKVIVS
jgi:hypothetical protein